MKTIVVFLAVALAIGAYFTGRHLEAEHQEAVRVSDKHLSDSLAAIERQRFDSVRVGLDSQLVAAIRRTQQIAHHATASDHATDSVSVIVDSLALQLDSAQTALDSLRLYPAVVSSLRTVIDTLTNSRNTWKASYESSMQANALLTRKAVVDSSEIERLNHLPPIVIHDTTRVSSRTFLGLRCVIGAGPVLTLKGAQLAIGTLCGK